MIIMQSDNNAIFDYISDDKLSIQLSDINLKSNVPHDVTRGFATTFIFESIIIPSNVNLHNITSFVVSSVGGNIWDIPFDLFLDNVEKIDDSYYIQIPQKIFSEKSDRNFLLGEWCEVPIGILPYTYIKIELTSVNNFDFTITLHHVIYPELYREKLNREIIRCQIYQYQTFHCDGCFPQTIKAYGKINAIYVKTYSPIKYFKLLSTFRQYPLIDLNSQKIKYYGNLVGKYGGWTTTHSIVLKKSIGYTVPRELIEIIDSYCEKIYWPIYIYKFPIGQVGKSHIANAEIEFNKNGRISVDLVTEEKLPEVTIYFSSDGMCATRFRY
jgi:hypothetical protein